MTAADGTKYRALNVNYSIVDDVLHFMVDYDAHVSRDNGQPADYMEELDQTITEKENSNA